MSGIFALKLLLVPSLIAAITLAGKRWGATVAGCFAGFPVVAGPILFFLALEQGPVFAQNAAVAAMIGVLSNIAFGLSYSWVSRRYPWPVSLVSGLLIYFAVVILLGRFPLNAWQAALITIAGLKIAARLYPDEANDIATVISPKSDLLYRATAGLVLVLLVTLFSSQLGSKLSGLFSVFPGMGSVLAVFSHRNIGQPYAVRLLRGMVQGFYAFVGFCVVLASCCPLGQLQ